MKIATVEAIPLEIPFTHGGKPFGWGGQVWTHNVSWSRRRLC